MKPRWLCTLFLVWACMWEIQAQEDAFSRSFYFSSFRGTIYDMLNRITERSGFLFVYDSNLIDNEKKVSVPKGNYSLREAILLATGEKELHMKIVGQHILLYKGDIRPAPSASGNADALSFPAAIVRGTVREKQSGAPLPYASVGVYQSGVGTVTNQNGDFMLKLPDTLQKSTIYISYLGYEPQNISSELLLGRHTNFYLQSRTIPLEEVIVRLVNPIGILKEMLQKRPDNYASEPVYLTSFYREGVEKRKSLLTLTEAVFKIYKTGFQTKANDQVKLLKMRRIYNKGAQDTLSMKIKAGVEASLMLDLVKNIPDFLTFDEYNLYHYSKIDMSVVDSHLTHVIAFEQKEGIRAALYKGELYIDAENSALVAARLEVNPQYIHRAADIFILKKSRGIKITPKKVVYTVAYKPWNGTYYISHLRGDLDFRIKRKKQIFYSPVHAWFEMAICKIDTVGVKRFPHRESLPVNKIFSETRFPYDKDFWGDFNIILPEEKLSEALFKIHSRIEEIE